MKNYKLFSAIIVLIATTAVLLFSCNTDTIEQEQAVAVSTDSTGANSVSDFRKALAALPVGDRTEIFNCLRNEMKVALWKDRLSSVSNLNADEAKAISRLSEELTPELYTDTGKANFLEKYTSWEKEAMVVFGNDSMKLYSIIALLDDPADGDGKVVMPIGKDDPCDCSIPSDFCWLRNRNLVCANPKCVATIGGCGLFLLFPCDALCVKKPNPGG